jgi:hypothetical protein
MDMIAGWLVCVGLLLLGWRLGAPVIIALFGSFAFGSTAIVSLGGTTLPAYIGLSALLIVSTVAARSTWSDLAEVLKSQRLAQLTCALTLYALTTSFFFPRLFADATKVFVPVAGVVVPTLLAPVPGNTNQAVYFLMDGLVFLAVAILLRRGIVSQIRVGLVVWAAINAALGLTDVIGKTIGMGDILAPIRTANYAMLSDHVVGSFYRIMGGFPEASAYAAAALPSLAFSFMDWRATKSRFSLCIALVLLILLVLSTSSTAYGGLVVLAGLYGISAVVSLLRARMSLDQIALIVTAVAIATIWLALSLYDEQILEPVVNMILDATVNKTNSESAIERGMWNDQSIQNFIDTYGVGVGLGSTRSSSWVISVLAQLGTVGIIAFLIAIVAFLAALVRQNNYDPFAASVAAAALAGIAGASFGGGNADPGMVFFIALAIVSASFSRRPRPTLQRANWRMHFPPPLAR